MALVSLENLLHTAEEDQAQINTFMQKLKEYKS